jgi:hypothetical protein
MILNKNRKKSVVNYFRVGPFFQPLFGAAPSSVRRSTLFCSAQHPLPFGAAPSSVRTHSHQLGPANFFAVIAFAIVISYLPIFQAEQSLAVFSPGG